MLLEEIFALSSALMLSLVVGGLPEGIAELLPQRADVAGRRGRGPRAGRTGRPRAGRRWKMNQG